MSKHLPYLRFQSNEMLLSGRASLDRVLDMLKLERSKLRPGTKGYEHRLAFFSKDIRHWAGLRAQVSRLLRDRGADPAYEDSSEGQRARAAAGERWERAFPGGHPR